MKRVIVAAIGKNEYDKESIERAIRKLFDEAFKSSYAYEILHTNDITYDIHEIKFRCTSEIPLEYEAIPSFTASSPDFSWNSPYNAGVHLDIPLGRKVDEDEFITDEYIKYLVLNLHNRVTSKVIQSRIDQNIKNFRAALDVVNQKYSNFIRLEYAVGRSAIDSSDALCGKLVKLGKHNISERFEGLGYLDNNELLPMSNCVRVEDFNLKNNHDVTKYYLPFKTKDISVAEFVAPITRYVRAALQFLDVFERCLDIKDDIEYELHELSAESSYDVSVHSRRGNDVPSGMYYWPTVIITASGKEYTVVDIDGNQIIQLNDIIMKSKRRRK